MRRIVAMLHQNDLVRRQPGFPKSVLRTETGEALCSWRLTITYNPLYAPYLDQPWNSPLNQTVDDNYRKLFAVKSRSRPSKYTHIFALTGPGTAFTEFEKGNGRPTTEAEPDAILLIDCKNELIHWMEPGDVDVKPLMNSPNESGIGFLEPNYPDGYLVAFVDGAVWWITKDVPRDVIAQFFTVEGARAHDREQELSQYALDKLPPLPTRDGRWWMPSADDN